MEKLAGDNVADWDLCLTQALAAVRFTINETTKFLPYYMLFGRDVVLPMYNLLRPRRKYMGEEQQHRLFVQARRRIKRAQKRRNDRVNASKKMVEFRVGKIRQEMGTIL